MRSEPTIDRFFRFWAVAIIGLGSIAAPTRAADPDADPVRYRVEFPNRLHHEAQVEMTLTGLEPGPVAVRMSRSSPGRYRLHEFARNVYSFAAFDTEGRALEVVRPDPWGWEVRGHRGSVTLRYTVFGDLVSGTYSAIDGTHAHLNPPATFAWVRGLEKRPVVLEIVVPTPDWRVATQLESTEDPYVFHAKDRDYFLDSPIEISDFELRQWRAGDPDQDFRLAIHHDGSRSDVDDFVDATRRVVAAATAIFGELPQFDFGTYTFIANYLPWSHGDAMEHRNSTTLASPASLAVDAADLLETLAHEFLHVWNVERLRPRSLEPFDFENVNFSSLMWFAEGFTSYYDGLVLVRAGEWDLGRWSEELTIGVDRVVNSPAPSYGGPAYMSRLATFRDRGQWVDPQNTDNTYLHYYYYGEAIALALDLELRARFETDLDALMRAMWRDFGRTEAPYTAADLEAALAASSESEFARSFFARYIEGSEVPSYAELLEPAGLGVRRRHPNRSWIGEALLDFSPRGAEVGSATIEGSPLYEAGIDRGDRIVSLGGRKLKSHRRFEELLARHWQPGEELEVVVETRGGTVRRRLVPTADPHLEVVPVEETGRTPSPEDLRFRRAWLGTETP